MSSDKEYVAIFLEPIEKSRFYKLNFGNAPKSDGYTLPQFHELYGFELRPDVFRPPDSRELGEMLDKVSRAEESSKSYYIKKKLEDLEDYQGAKQAHDEFMASGEKAVPFNEVKK